MNISKLPKGPISADDLARLKAEMLGNDPEYRAKVEAVEAKRVERADRLRQAEATIVTDIHKVGIQVDSVWDLVNTAKPYDAALPVLMEHFERGGYPEDVMESLGRALAVKPAVEFWGRLKACWLSARDTGEEHGAAIALAVCATEAQFEDLVGFLPVHERGETRIYFLQPILEVGGERGRRVIEGLRRDPVFGAEARSLLKARQR